MGGGEGEPTVMLISETDAGAALLLLDSSRLALVEGASPLAIRAGPSCSRRLPLTIGTPPLAIPAGPCCISRILPLASGASCLAICSWISLAIVTALLPESFPVSATDGKGTPAVRLAVGLIGLGGSGFFWEAGLGEGELVGDWLSEEDGFLELSEIAGEEATFDIVLTLVCSVLVRAD